MRRSLSAIKLETDDADEDVLSASELDSTGEKMGGDGEETSDRS